MKKLFILMMTILSAYILSGPVYTAPILNSESGPGNGTDYVKVLFANARVEAIELLEGLNADTISHLEIEDYFKEWLLDSVEGSPRYIKLKFYAKNFKFKFQEDPCPAENSICFYLNPDPLVVVSMKENQATNEKQAVTMLLHEIGHFTGELDHLFLDRFAAEMVETSESQFVVVELQNKRFVSSIFEAANQCERGSGEQVESLKTRLNQNIQEQCIKRKLSCDLTKVEYSFSAELPSIGLGFDSTTLCTGKALLKALRAANN